jgi:acyl dehydratase
VLKASCMKYLEDFTLGETEIIDGYLITAEEIISFAQKWDPQPMHTDPKVAQTSSFGGLIASGVHLIAIAVHQLVTSPTPVATIGAVGVDHLRFLEPGRPGDVVRVSSECIEVRPSNSNPDRGVVRNKVILVNQDGKHLLSYVAILLISRRPQPTSGV